MKPIFLSQSTRSKGKILILADEIYPQVCVGGLGKFVAGISRGLKENNWEVAVFVPRSFGQIYLPYYSPKGQLRSKKLAKKALNWCRQNTWIPSWVWVQDWDGVYQAEIWRGKAKIIWTIHSPIDLNGRIGLGYDYSEQEDKDDPINWGNEFFDFAGLIEKGIINADLVTAVSPTFTDELSHSFLFSKADRILGISNGVDSKEWDPSKDSFLGFKLGGNWREFKIVNKKILQSIFGLPNKDVPVFTFVSRLVPQKGIDLLIKTLPKFLAKNEIQLIVVGQGLKKYCHFFENFKNNFFFKVGICLESNFSLPHQVFAGADFLLLPSLTEPFGIVIAESQSYGVVPIVRKVGGLIDQVQDGVNGLNFDKNTPDALFSKLYQALELWQTNWWWKTSESGIRSVENWTKVITKYEKYLLGSGQKGDSSFRRPKEALFFNRV